MKTRTDHPTSMFARIAVPITATMAFWFSAAHAAPGNAPSTGSLHDSGQVKVMGIVKGEGSLKDGGKSVPLSRAIQSILPPGFSMRVLGDGPWVNAPVSWSGGKAWVDTLHEILEQAPDIAADVIVGARAVILRPRRHQVNGFVAQAAAKVEEPEAKIIAAPQAPQAPQVMEPPREQVKAPIPAWHINLEDRTLRNVITRWAHSAGWQLNWDFEYDYPVHASAAINGSFEEAVESLVKSVGHSEAPLAAVFYKGNRVLRVVPKGVVR